MEAKIQDLSFNDETLRQQLLYKHKVLESSLHDLLAVCSWVDSLTCDSVKEE